jgi:hypothetical protein
MARRFRYHDVRTERVGGFGGPVNPNAPVGKYAGPPRMRWRASGGFVATADDQRQGSFADIDPPRAGGDTGRQPVLGSGRRERAMDAGPWTAEQDVTRGRSAGTVQNPLRDPTRGRSAGTPENPLRDPMRAGPARPFTDPTAAA